MTDAQIENDRVHGRRDHAGIGWRSQYCTETQCRCHEYGNGWGPFMHYTYSQSDRETAK
jgi:hypothetical protein